MTTVSARPPREDPAELARDYLWLAKRAAPPGTEEHARFRKLRSRLLAYGERFESIPVELDATPGPALEVARWFRDPGELIRTYRAVLRGESLFLRCHRPLPAGAWITFAFREGPARLLEMVVVARAPGVKSPDTMRWPCSSRMRDSAKPPRMASRTRAGSTPAAQASARASATAPLLRAPIT